MNNLAGLVNIPREMMKTLRPGIYTRRNKFYLFDKLIRLHIPGSEYTTIHCGLRIHRCGQTPSSPGRGPQLGHWMCS